MTEEELAKVGVKLIQKRRTNGRSGFLVGVLVATAVYGIGAGFILLGPRLAIAPGPVEPSGCVESTRIITSDDKGWTKCDHPSHLMVERSIGYGRALVSCSCKPPGAPGDPGPAMIETPDPNWDGGADANPYPDPMRLDDEGRPR